MVLLGVVAATQVVAVGSSLQSSPSTGGSVQAAESVRPQASSAAVPGGINFGNYASTFDHLPSAQQSLVMAQVAATGATYVRVDVQMDGIELTPGQFDWYPDPEIHAALSHGLHVDALLGWPSTVALLANGQINIAALAAFEVAAARHYSGMGVNDFEIWNEPNMGQGWSGNHRVDVEAYAQLLQSIYPQIKAIDPQSTVLVGGLSPAADAPDGSNLSPQTFLSELYSDGGQGTFDAVADHPYSYPDLPNQAAAWNPWTYMPTLHSIMAAHGDGGKAIWYTEFGAPVSGNVHQVNLTSQAAMYSQAFALARSWTWSGPLFAYNWSADNDGTGDFGLFDAAWNPRPALQAYEQALSSAGTAEVQGCPSAHSQSAVGKPVGIAAAVSTSGCDGYWVASAKGVVSSFGGLASLGGVSGLGLDAPIISVVATPSLKGYWLLAADGGVFAFGDARFYGSTGGERLNAPIVGMDPTPDGRGYWLVASDGGVFAFGDARFYGSTGSRRLNLPVTGMASTPDGLGYWLVARDGGIFAFGDAEFYGSMGGSHLNKPVVAITADPTGGGYRLVAADGGIFAFGDAAFYGSVGSQRLGQPIVSSAVSLDGHGYYLLCASGTVYSFGDVANLGNVLRRQ